MNYVQYCQKYGWTREERGQRVYYMNNVAPTDWQDFSSAMVLSQKTYGPAYMTSDTSCTCPDWRKRVSKGYVQYCKHQIALFNYQDEVERTGDPYFPLEYA